MSKQKTFAPPQQAAAPATKSPPAPGGVQLTANDYQTQRILQLQKILGNQAVARLFSAHPPAAASAPQPPPPGAATVQGAFQGHHYVDYGNKKNDCGTTMHAELHPGHPDLQKGSSPTVKPNWWPNAPPATDNFFSGYMVQGHLLNDNVGGPGNNMKNLTPITRSANTTHEKQIEKEVKYLVLNNKAIVEYYVEADYSYHPTGKNLGAQGAVKADIDNNYSQYMAGEIWAEYTAYDTKKPHNELLKRNKAIEIKNESTEFKGGF